MTTASGSTTTPTTAEKDIILLKLNERAPLLASNAQTIDIIMHRLQTRQKAYELGIVPYVIGVATGTPPVYRLPGDATQANKVIGKRWLLSAFEDENVRGMVAQHGAASRNREPALRDGVSLAVRQFSEECVRPS
ncbi:hypothetical protein AB1Y20_015704 [Prymnesium parvum]|uniref:Uncharacterized protein n=1 Tax=Prymnesium parvum TaxID=97485 RepID=A0AB34JYI9_PRYPA